MAQDLIINVILDPASKPDATDMVNIVTPAAAVSGDLSISVNSLSVGTLNKLKSSLDGVIRLAMGGNELAP